MTSDQPTVQSFGWQVKAAGIVSPIVGDIKVKKFSDNTFTKVFLKKVFKIQSVAVITFMALGNSDWHGPLCGVPISFTLVALLMWGTVEQCAFATLNPPTAPCGWTESCLFVGRMLPFLGRSGILRSSVERSACLFADSATR